MGELPQCGAVSTVQGGLVPVRTLNTKFQAIPLKNVPKIVEMLNMKGIPLHRGYTKKLDRRTDMAKSDWNCTLIIYMLRNDELIKI